MDFFKQLQKFVVVQINWTSLLYCGSVLLEWFYLNRETDNNNQCKIATKFNKQKKTME